MILLERPTKPIEYYDHRKNYGIAFGEKGYFVFGSNLKGIHGKGAAKTAHRHYGAKYGEGIGFTGRSYAIPTKDGYLQSLPIPVIDRHIKEFVSVTDLSDLDDSWFLVTAVGCGLAGYRPDQIAPLFKGAYNCWFPDNWEPYLT